MLIQLLFLVFAPISDPRLMLMRALTKCSSLKIEIGILMSRLYNYTQSVLTESNTFFLSSQETLSFLNL